MFLEFTAMWFLFISIPQPPPPPPEDLDNEFVQQLEDDFEDFIAEDEITGLETDFSDLVIPRWRRLLTSSRRRSF